MTIEDLNTAMLRWRKIFEDLHLPYILYQSTVLGLVRNGKLYEERVAEFAIDGNDLTDEIYTKLKITEDYQWRNENPHKAPHGLMYFRDCEIQPIYFKNGKGIYNLLDDRCLVFSEELLKKENWETISYKGLDWPTPAKREQYLEEAYGDWKTPKPHYNWQTDANNEMKWDKI